MESPSCYCDVEEDNNEAVVEWLEKQGRNKEDSIIRQNIDCIKRDRVLTQVFHLISSNPGVAVESMIQIGQQLSASQRGQVVRMLTSMDDLNATCTSIEES